MTHEQRERFAHACTLFAAMDRIRKDRVTRVFDLLRAAPGVPTIYDCFVESVNDEVANIECEIRLGLMRPAKGTA